MKDYIHSFLRKNKTAILTFICFAPFYLTFGCPIRFFSGISCPSCGMSRAAQELLFLDFAQAFYFHPLVFLLPVALAVYLFRKRIPTKYMTVLCITALVLLLAVYVIRLTNNSDIVFFNIREGMIYKLLHEILN